MIQSIQQRVEILGNFFFVVIAQKSIHRDRERDQSLQIFIYSDNVMDWANNVLRRTSSFKK